MEENRVHCSLVVPFFNEEENVVPVLTEAVGVLPDMEIIAVDDGSTDRTWEKISSLPQVHGLRLHENRGQSAAMYLGMQRARGRILCLMDGDGQNDPKDIPVLLARLEKDGLDVVCGYRARRRDTLSKRMASRIANRIRRTFLKDGIRDTGCSVKVFKREALAGLVPFDGLHRYLPAFFIRSGCRIGESAVNHRPRRSGDSKYSNFSRAMRGLYDLVGVSWLLRRKINFPKTSSHDGHNII